DMVVLNTSAGGFALSEGKTVSVVLDCTGPLTPNGECSGKVITVVEDDPRVPVGRAQMVLTATGRSVEKLAGLGRGDLVELRVKTTGIDWKRAQNVVGGGPVIVSSGKPIQAWDAENFNSEFAAKRHPRTAVGYTKLGDIWLVIVEGRQSLS